MKRYLCLLLLSFLLLLPATPATAEMSMAVGEVHGFAENLITLCAPAPGEVVFTLSDEYRVWRSWSQQVVAGENRILWDGLGWHREKLPGGSYSLAAELLAADGTTAACRADIRVGQSRNALLFALPCQQALYLGDGTRWRCEMRLACSGGEIVTEFYHSHAPEQLLGTKRNRVESGYLITYTWDGRIAGKAAAPGTYVLRFWEKSNPAYTHQVQVEVREGKAPVLPLAVTGSLLPTPGMDDRALWALMQQPSVVADLPHQTDHLKLRSQKGGGTVLGTVHGQSQALEVLRLEGDYALVAAWNHECGGYTEGWVPQKQLRVVAPSPDYGLLVDKAAQTLTVYHRGQRLGTLPVSTGLMAENRLIRETAAGSFLTVDRISSFSDDKGYRFDYAIRYDGGNLLHQIGYLQQGGKRDFADHTAQLGTKASQGCIRLPALPGEAGLNAYWLYTHLPYGTRIMILDDPAQRRLQQAAVDEAAALPAQPPVAPPPLEAGQSEVLLTIGGDVVLGTRESWWAREDALPAYLEQCGLGYPFVNLLPLFTQDDITLLNLECVLKEDAAGEDREKLYRFRGLPGWAQCLAGASVEQVSVANNHYIDYGTAGQQATLAALEAAGVAYSGFEYTCVCEVQGWRIGFAGCRETVYKRDPNVVQRDIRRLKAAGCDAVIYTCHWGREYSPTHNALQRQMALAAAAAGADVVIGGHPHVVQGLDTAGSVPVVYSLGNLMFGGTIDLTTFDGMLVQLRLRFGPDGYCGCTLQPIPVLTSSRAAEGVNDYCPIVAQGEDRERILRLVQQDTPFPLLGEMYFPARRP